MGRAKNIHIRREEGTSMIKTIGSLWGMDKHSFIDRREWSQYWGACHSITTHNCLQRLYPSDSSKTSHHFGKVKTQWSWQSF